MLPSPSLPQVDSPRGTLRDDCWGFAASSALHVAAIAALSLACLPASSPRLPPTVETTWNVDELDEPDDSRPIELTQPALNQSGGSTTSVIVSTDPPATEPMLVLDQRVAELAGPLIDEVDLREDVQLASATASTGTGRGVGNGVGDGAGSGRGPNFFPLDRPTGRFVFVVDCSKSMTHRYPGPAKSRLGRVKVELWRTIYRMSPEQKFFIVFFNTQAVPMPAVEFHSGGTENQSDLFHWTAQVRADGKTDPQDALLLAMRMQPDVVYFLTDGEFHYKAVREVTKANFGGVVIHTISLGDDAGEKFLREIAEKNHGTYRHIVEEEDRYWSDEPAAAASGAATSAAVVLPDDK